MVQWVLTKYCEGIRKGTLKYCMSMKSTVDSDNFEILHIIIHINIKIYVMHDHSEHTTKLFVPLQGHALSHAIFCKTIKIKPSKYREFVFACIKLSFILMFTDCPMVIHLPHDGILQCSYLDMLYRRLHKHVGQSLSDIHTHYFFLLILILLFPWSLFLCAMLAAYP